MRVAAMVVGILFAIWFFFEALLAGVANQGATGGGIIVSLLIGLGAVLVLSVPQVSMVLFTLGGLVSLLAGAGGYTNHYVYAFFGFMLAVFAFFGRRGQLAERREKAAERARQEDRDRRFEAMMYQQTLVPCRLCGHRNEPRTRYCGNCGRALVDDAPVTVPASEAEYARIIVEPVGPRLNGRYQFVAQSTTGDRHAESEAFPSGEMSFKRGRREEAALSAFLDSLREGGWSVARDGGEWYEYRLSR